MTIKLLIVARVSGGGGGDGGSTAGDTETIGRLQDNAQLALNRHIDATRGGVARPFRFGKLLLLLASLRAVSADTIEDVYFRSTIGDISVARIVADMYASADV